MSGLDEGLGLRRLRLRLALFSCGLAGFFFLAFAASVPDLVDSDQALAQIQDGNNSDQQHPHTQERNPKANDARRDAEGRAGGPNVTGDGNKNDEVGGGKKGPDIGGQIRDLDKTGKGGKGGPKTVSGPVPAGGNKPKAPETPVAGASAVTGDDEFINALINAAPLSELSVGAHDPHDAQTQLQWDRAAQHEADVETHLEHEFLRIQPDVATAMNAYLAAASTWQERFALISSASTRLQGLMADWAESKVIYEKADFAFAMANLGVGGVKIGYKAIRWISKAKTQAAIAQGLAEANAAAKAAGAAEGTSGAGKGVAVFEGAAGGTEAGADLTKTQKFDKVLATPGSGAAAEGAAAEAGADLTKTQKFDKVIAPPGSPAGATPVPKNQMYAPIANPAKDAHAARQSGIHAGLTADGALAEAEAQWAAQVKKMQAKLKKAQDTGKAAVAKQLAKDLEELKNAKPTAAVAMADTATQPVAISAKTAQNALDPQVLQAAKDAGVDVSAVAAEFAQNFKTLGAQNQAEWKILGMVAKAKGWHDMPVWAFNLVTNLMIEVRQTLAGVKGAKISPAAVETLKSIKTYVESKGVDFWSWLSKVGGEIGGPGKGAAATQEGIALLFDQNDIKLLKAVLETEGDVAKLRKVVSPIEQLSLNALAKADSATKVATTTEKISNAVLGVSKIGSAGAVLKPTDQQLKNVLNGTGALGEVGLSHVAEEFGVIDRTKDKFLLRAALGEMWELFTSPSATTASYYYTWVALDELEALMKDHSKELVEIGTLLDRAASALADLQLALNRAGINRADSYLNKGGPDELKKALDELNKAFQSGSDGWKGDHQKQYDDSRQHILDKLTDLADTMKSLAAMQSHMAKMITWLDSVRLNPDHSLKAPLELFNPQVFVRLASISLYLRGTAASAFDLTQDVPFHVVPSGDAKPKTAAAPAKVEKAAADKDSVAPPNQAGPKSSEQDEVEEAKKFEEFLEKSKEQDKKMGYDK